MRPSVLLVCVFGFTAFTSLAVTSLEGIPRYSARYRQNCNLCHHNPTGGGLRSTYASQYLVPVEMVVERLQDIDIESIRPDISENVTIGADLRTLHLAADVERPAPEGNFFQMQTDVYLSLQAGPRLSVYVDRGQSATLEAFGMAYVLPWNGYLKVGRFTPAFGWKSDDHRQFVRRFLFFDPPGHTDVGVEVGVYPRRFAFIASTFNGAGGLPFDNDEILGFAGRGSYRFALGPLGFSLGGSVWRNSEAAPEPGLRLAAGPFWYVNWGRLTWLGEIDWSRLDPRASIHRTAIVTSHEISLQLIQGLDLRATANYYDPDINQKTGIRQRLGFGFDSLLHPMLGVKAMLHRYRNDRGLLVDEPDYTQSEVLVHFFF